MCACFIHQCMSSMFVASAASQQLSREAGRRWAACAIGVELETRSSLFPFVVLTNLAPFPRNSSITHLIPGPSQRRTDRA